MLKLTVPFLVIMLLISSCSSTSPPVQLGFINDVKATDSNIFNYAHDWGIDTANLYILDSTGYRNTITAIKKSNRKLWHDLIQPMQIMIYNKSGEIMSYQLNCRTIITNSDWQYNWLGTFNSFPPKDESLKRFNRDLNVSQLASNFIHKDGMPLSLEEFNTKEFTIVAYWSIALGRQSQNLIKEVTNYQKKFPEQNIKYVFVNNDDYIR